MRDFTKSMLSFSWAMSLFGVQQTLDLLEPSKAAGAFNNVAEATKAEMGDTLKATFKAGDDLQRGLVDLAMGVFSGQSLNPSKLMRVTSDVMSKSAEAVGQGFRAATVGGQPDASGWGPMPGSPPPPGAATAAAKDAASTASQGWGPMPSTAQSSRE